MNAIVRTLQLSDWPLAAKFTAAFVTALLIPTLVIGVISQNLFQTAGVEALRADLNQDGSYHAENIQKEMTQVLGTMSQLAGQDALVTLLRADSPMADDVTQAASLMQGTLTVTDLMVRLRLIDTSGNLEASASDIDGPVQNVSANNRLLFDQAENALVQGRFQSALVYDDSGTTLVEFSYAVRDTQGNVLGFLVATFNNALLLDNLVADNLTILRPEGRSVSASQIPYYSYLITPGDRPIRFNRVEFSQVVERSLSYRTAVDRAFGEQNGVSQYTLGTDPGEVMGFYTTIPDPTNQAQALFAYVVEVPLSGLSAPLLGGFGGPRLFVLGLGLLSIVGVLVAFFHQSITRPLTTLRQAVQGAAHGNYEHSVPSAQRADEIGELSAAFVDMRAQMQTLIGDLEARIAARARDISATQDVSRVAATQRNLQNLLDQVVELVVEKFPSIYHAQVFLVDVDGRRATLRASTGQAGQLLLLRGHALTVGSVSVIGQATGQGERILVRNTAASPIHSPNEFLPETRAEMAIPLRIGSRVIGALDVQSKQVNPFDEDEISILQTLADQVAVGIENARLYQESTQRVTEIDRANRQATVRAWQEFIYGQRQQELSSQSGRITGEDLSGLRRRAVEESRIVIGEPTSHGTTPIAVPIQLRGQILGAVEWEIPSGELNENKLQLAQELAGRLAVSLDNARLIQESRRNAERERVVNAISAKLTPQTEISEILQTAVREVGQALRAPQVSIRLHRLTPDEKPAASSNGSAKTIPSKSLQGQE
ncbi:MAG: GAF domain-containing protein [Anaerolineae bacterium]|nr:GAF domain-containing protein [Anaerolineae bacterium]